MLCNSSIAFSLGFCLNSFLKTIFRVISVNIHATITIGIEWVIKSINENQAYDQIIILGGSQTSVATHPVSESKASAINIGVGLSFNILEIIIVIGTINIIVVTLSKISDNSVVRVHNATVNFHKFHQVFFATFIHKY
ncbi:hypothetical protein HOF65_00355 [bacterium]|jgi:hypothetical protein|nr:hypothetical protein [bacterium]MBT3852501.1 hypothetical protein [bacterium]MBT4632668.1 hypothetical protein [bacterium]MBT5491448.1 hypothetical protein [bacterium]MBT6778314.1 hypothetical protein [bacterium]